MTDRKKIPAIYVSAAALMVALALPVTGAPDLSA